MDVYEVKPINRPVNCEMEVPGSKSITNRALLLAALADGTTELEGVLFSDDARYFLKALKDLGFQLEADEEKRQAAVQGTGGRIPRNKANIMVGSAGTAARFLTVLLGLSEGRYRIEASEQMKKRPMQAAFDALQSLGAEIVYPETAGHLPVIMQGASVKTKSGLQQVSLDISESTQFLSAFLLSAPLFSDGLELRITGGKKDGAYVAITRQMMRSFGLEAKLEGGDHYHFPAGISYQTPGIYAIEPDVSAACYFYAAAAVTGGNVCVKGVHPGMMQGDLQFLNVLERMGCTWRDQAEGIRLQGPAEGQLKGITVNMNNFSDQALTLAAIAPYSSSDVDISGIAHIRGQECDRIHAMAVNLKAAGISCEEREDGICIHPGHPHGCRIRTFEDHRVAMAFTVLGYRTEGIVIENPFCCRKTFPDYFEKIKRLYE